MCGKEKIFKFRDWMQEISSARFHRKYFLAVIMKIKRYIFPFDFSATHTSFLF